MRLVCDCCNDITNIEADRMEIQGDKLDVRIKNALDRFQPDEGREAYTSP